MQSEVSVKLKCLLVKLSDGRKFFTEKKRHPELIEFANALKAKLDVVEAEDPEILSLKELAESVCIQTKKSKPTAYKIIKKKKTQEKQYFSQHTSFSKLTTRQKLSMKTSIVRDYIALQFNAGNDVKIKDIAKKFEKHGISIGAIYKHINIVKATLEASNKKIIKVMPGLYRMEN